MAEIHLERKKKPVWPWIIGLLLLLLLIWLVVRWMAPADVPATTDTVLTDTMVTDTMGTMSPVTGTTAATAGVPNEVREFTLRCRVAQGATPEAAGLEHEWTRTCLDLLARSISAVAAQRSASTDITQRVDTVRQQIESIRQSDATSVQHSNQAREAAIASAEALRTMQQAFAGTSQQVQSSVENAHAAAQQIRGTEALLNQKDTLTRFFGEAGTALEGMATPAQM